jgi:arsenate reductase
VDEVAGGGFDRVVTVCDQAKQHCPHFPGDVRRLHAGFDDPPRLAASAATEEAAFAPQRRVRDEIRAFVASLPDPIAAGK